MKHREWQVDLAEGGLVRNSICFGYPVSCSGQINRRSASAGGIQAAAPRWLRRRVGAGDGAFLSEHFANEVLDELGHLWANRESLRRKPLVLAYDRPVLVAHWLPQMSLGHLSSLAPRKYRGH